MVRPTRGFKPEGAGTSSGVAADSSLEFARVAGSSLSEGVVLLNVAGIPGLEVSDSMEFSGTLPDEGAGAEGVEQFQALGIVGRPLPPQSSRGIDEFAEVVCVKTGDGLVPIAVRDTRLKMQGDAPGEGSLAFVGYGGGFHSLTPVEGGGDPAGGGTIHVIYCPYDFDANGVAQKAHSIILDPTPDNESIIIAHAEGMAITMFDGGKKELTMKNAAGDTSLVLDDDGLKIQGNQIQLNAPTIIFGDPTTAVPLLPGIASPGSSMIKISPAFVPL